MTELFLMFSEIMPFDEIADLVKDSMETYLADKSEHNRRQLVMFCALLASKEAVDGRKSSDVAKELEQVKRIKERLNSEKV